MEGLFSVETTYFADVILPVPIPRMFTYRVPRNFVEDIKVGARVIVEFGKNRVVTAVVGRIHNTPPAKYQAKYILELLDTEPLITKQQLWLFDWIAEYYMCCVGEVMNVAVPSGLKVTSQSRIQLNPDFDHPELLEANEVDFLEILKNQTSLTYDDAIKFVGETNINTLIKSLIGKHAIIMYEEVKEKYKPKIAKKVRLKRVYEGVEEAANLIDSLSKNAKQQLVILEYFKQIPLHQLRERNQHGVDKSFFTQGETSDSSLNKLIEKGILEQFEVVVSRFGDEMPEEPVTIQLTDAQQQASDEILTNFQEKDIVLLHGITGSGKTEIYIDLIQKVLDGGSQVLFLLPEIALTTQIVVRLKRVFGDRMGVYHSKFSDNERVEVWKGVLDGRYQFVVGVRSAVFLPMDNLGLVIVDEEHESSYKQYEPAPRYHARDVGIMLGLKQGAKILLGSATPSLESYHQATTGKYGLVTLNQRYGNAQLPDIRLIDLKAERKAKNMRNDFSSVLCQHIEENLANGEQTIIFQNRRGYSPYLNCQECNWIGECEQCAVSLTYHLNSKELRCHYCGHKEEIPRACPACGSGKIRTVGFGTEKLEDDLRIMYPAARVQRMDLDTTRTKNAYQNIIGEFEQGNTDILVGTQMISKGLDFDRVSLVGIFDADRMIHFPDFRAAERAFQMLTQVSGRAGRREKKGLVLIQTNNTQQSLLHKVIANDYLGYYQDEIKEREGYFYPPFTRIISVTVKHEEHDKAEKASQWLANVLLEKLGKARVLGPEKAMVERVRNKFLYDIVLKLEKDKLNIKAAKVFLQEKIDELMTLREFRGVYVVVDVDAV
ncbi:primosomal protein N' [Emticicia oligotrophica DSM 17448]|uniref:Replication restart protein PriA n=1 Tax=Emticicia oligotrophica (strain DSM 17448 / CIP 109782 / MTCC 6937 / GPTSA100-15) TaxID=929562 RepID=A0ABN4AKC9_EMTOG|nr:primosomal protein N' [Emticicia oligotrophica]AFK02644.1 primosomal protein N' [Emticicia oligotrophica DSM 17448]